MMNASHNNISGINKKDKRGNEINQENKNQKPSTSKSLITVI